MPDDIVMDLVKERIKKKDCSLNGWILDGCPNTEEQILSLKNENIKPQLVLVLE